MSKIGLFDMDGTLFDYPAQLREDYSKLMAPGETIPDDLHDESIPYVKARVDLIRSKPGWWKSLPKFQLGWDVYYLAESIGFCTHILTKGPVSKPTAWAEKVLCIQEHFPADVVVNIVGKTKKHYYGVFLCDDYPKYVLEWLQYRPRGVAIIPAQPYNLHFMHPRVVRYDGSNIDQVASILEQAYDRQPGEPFVPT